MKQLASLLLAVALTTAGCGAITLPRMSGADLFISEMSDDGIDEMCEVWSQDSDAVLQRFEDLGYSWDESVLAVRNACPLHRPGDR